jgi:hypothetical protein
MSDPIDVSNPSGALSRRDFLNGVSGAALLLALSGQEANAMARPPLTLKGIGGSGGGSTLTKNDLRQLPFVGDASGWCHSEYYETIQAGRRQFPKTVQTADIDGDGRDELIMRGPLGVLTHHYLPEAGQWIQMPNGPALTDGDGFNQKQYRRTLQTADIDGDKQAELLIRSSTKVLVYKFGTDGVWSPMASIEGLSDLSGWNQDQYYTTIQCADIDGDGQDELLARGVDGVIFYQYNIHTGAWSPSHSGPSDFSDELGWDDVTWYPTIQCADIDGDGQDELLGRSWLGINAYRYNKADGKWTTLSIASPALSDHKGWVLTWGTVQCADIDGDGQAELLSLTPSVQNPSRVSGLSFWKFSAGGWQEMAPLAVPEWIHYDWSYPGAPTPETVQGADIDGDGQAEILVRDRTGLRQFHYDVPSGEWSERKLLAAWSDANNWDQVQFFSTIQTARLLKPGDRGYSGEGAHIQRLLLGRASGGMQTYRYDTSQNDWFNPSASFPAFTGKALEAYNYITTGLGIEGTGDYGIRGRYNDQAGSWDTWIDDLLGIGPHPVAAPTDNPAWEAVKSQIINEMTWVKRVQLWYASYCYTQINAAFLDKKFTLHRVGELLSYQENDSTELALSILALIAGAFAATLGFPVLDAGTAASVLATLSNVFAGAAEFFPGEGNAVQVQYNQLQDQLSAGFNAMLTQLATQVGITGGLDGNGYNPGDYGLLYGIGSMIVSTIWNWPDDSAGLVTGMQRGYGIEIFKVLFTAFEQNASYYDYWMQVEKSSDPIYTPDDYPVQSALYTLDEPYRWISLYQNVFDYPSTDTLQKLFDPPVPGSVFPLGASASDMYLAQNGWPDIELWDTDRGLSAPPPITRSHPITLSPDLRLTASLARDTATQEILATLTLKNMGITAATNVEIGEARLNLRRSTASPSRRRIRLAQGRSDTYTLRFPALTRGATAVLKVSGRYLGGTFGGSFRLKLP